jgi:AraC-like DNA-binding protein
MIEALNHGIGAYARGDVIGPAKWPHYDVIIITRGDATFTVGGLPFHCGSGSALIIPPRYHFEGTAGCHGCVIWVQHFRYRTDRGRDPGLKIPKFPEIWRGTAEREWPLVLMRQASALQKASTSVSADLPHLLFLLIHALQEQHAAHGSEVRNTTTKIQSLIEWIEKQPHPLPSVKQLAERTGWSLSHFRNGFRRHCGRSVGGYLRELRMREAARLLCQSNLAIKEISIRLGYGDQVAFHRAFVNHTGRTPGLFRTTAPRVA